MCDPFWGVRDHKHCARRIDYSDHTRAGCDPWAPCAACRAAKARAEAARDEAHRAYCTAWFEGMLAREQRVIQVRRELGWTAEQYPTDREQLEGCELKEYECRN